MKQNIIRALLDLNIIFKSKYYDELSFEHGMYGKIVDNFVREKLNTMNPYEMFRYKLFKRVKELKFGTKYSGV